VRFSALGHYGGQICLVLGALTLVPAVFALADGTYSFAACTAAGAAGLAIFGETARRASAPTRLQANEAFVISASPFIVAPLVMTPAFVSAGMSFTDALFECISGVTTTGLSMLPSVENVPRSLLFARAWMQWYGGLGFIALALGMLSPPAIAARRLSTAETDKDQLVGNIRIHSRRVLGLYVAMTVLGVVLTAALSGKPFASLIHTLASVSTGGFSSYDASLAGLGGWPVRIAVLAVCFLGAVSFSMHYRIYTERNLAVLRDPDVRWLFLMSILGTLCILTCMVLIGGGTWSGSAGDALALSFSAQTTTGFSTTSVESLPAAAKLVLMAQMFVGGDMGSSAGGIKLIRFFMVLHLLRFVLRRASTPPHAVVHVRVHGKRLDADQSLQALLIVGLFALTVAISWGPFVALGYDPVDSLFDVVSATATVGLSTGITSATLPPLLKGILGVDMLLGRMEMLALLMCVFPSTWFGKRGGS
jgi:trk system potassium uptake protein TrkH